MSELQSAINTIQNDIQQTVITTENNILNTSEHIIEGSTINKISEDIVSNAYKYVIEPQMKANEELKRQFKAHILLATFIIIGINFIIVIAALAAVMYGILFSDKISLEYCKELLSFLKYFVSIIFIEFISILFFIVKNVFDTSMSDIFQQMFENWHKK